MPHAVLCLPLDMLMSPLLAAADASTAARLPDGGQVTLVLLAAAAFTAAGIAVLARLRALDARRREDTSPAPSSAWGTGLQWLGIILTGIVIAWHSALRGNSVPLGDNFEAILWLALMLALAVRYVQWRRPVGGLELFVMPLVVLLLCSATLFGNLRPQAYNVHSLWLGVHRVTSYGGAAVFAVAAVSGALYLHVRRKLKHREFEATHTFGSLERLEGLTYSAVTFGFLLLTIGLITGLVRLAHAGETTLEEFLASPKLWLGLSGWLVYAVILHAPINPSFRGRRTAVLSVVGFVLMIGTIVAVQWMPDRTTQIAQPATANAGEVAW